MKSLNQQPAGEEKVKNILLKKYLFGNTRLRIGILLLIFGLLWYGKRTGLFASDIFGPLVMLSTGIWLIFTYFINRVINKYNNWASSLKLEHGDFYGL